MFFLTVLEDTISVKPQNFAPKPDPNKDEKPNYPIEMIKKFIRARYNDKVILETFLLNS